MISGQWVEARLNIGEITLEELGDVRQKPPAVWHGGIGAGARPRPLPRLVSRQPCGPSHGEAVADIPCHPGQLASPIGGACGEAGEGSVHLSRSLNGGRPRLVIWDQGDRSVTASSSKARVMRVAKSMQHRRLTPPVKDTVLARWS